MTLLIRSDPTLILLSYVLTVCVITLPMQGMRAVETEAGGIELMSAYAWFCALMLFAATYRRTAFRQYWYATVLLTALLARELDLDKAFFDSGILSLRHYSGTAPIWQKAVGGFVCILLVTAGLALLLRGAKPFFRGLVGWQTGQILIFAAIVLTILGKSLDGLFRKMWGVGIEVSTKTIQVAQIAEESAELAASLCVMSAVPRLPLDGAWRNRLERKINA